LIRVMGEGDDRDDLEKVVDPICAAIAGATSAVDAA
jgi:hypothetical protein